MNLDQCEVPPCYCGQQTQSVASVIYVRGVLRAKFYTDAASAALNGTAGLEPLPGNMVRIGDLIQFNCQGPMYWITGPTGARTSTSTTSSLAGACHS